MLALDKISNGELDKLQEINGHEPTFHLIAGGAPNPDHDPHIFSGKLLAEEGDSDSDAEGIACCCCFVVVVFFVFFFVSLPCCQSLSFCPFMLSWWQ